MTALAELLADPASVLLALDYDGTLAPIVDDPGQAHPQRGAVAALARCTKRFGTVAIVTGRPADTLVQLLGTEDASQLDGLVVVGHYGLERWSAEHGTSAPTEHSGVEIVRRSLAGVLANAPPEVRVEDKGHSVAVHTRETDDPAGVLGRLRVGLEQLAGEAGLDVQPGRFVLELRPPGTDKGGALRALVEETGATTVLYCGDDVGDTAAYDALDALRAEGVRCVAVFADSDEGPAALRDRADVIVDGPGGVVELLEELVADGVREAHERNQAQYGAVAANYATSGSHAGGDDLAWFSERASSVMPTRAVDVACGGGFSTRALLGAGHAVLATDLTPASVGAARDAIGTHERLAFAVGAAERLPVPTATVGLVGCRIAPHHFGDIAGFVDEAARVLQPGGMFLLVDTTVSEAPALAQWLDDVERLRDPSHGRSWPGSRWKAVLRGAGFDVPETRFTRKRHELDDWLARAGCTGDAAAEVRATFRAAPPEIDAYHALERDEQGEVVAYTDSKICIRALRPIG